MAGEEQVCRIRVTSSRGSITHGPGETRMRRWFSVLFGYKYVSNTAWDILMLKKKKKRGEGQGEEVIYNKADAEEALW